MRRSLSSISTARSSGRSGATTTCANAVWRRCACRTGTADEPVHAALGLEDPVGVLALDRQRSPTSGPPPRPGSPRPARSAKPRSSAQRRYMRSIISAQSWASVPPAPAWIETTASPRVVLAVEERVLLQAGELARERLELRLDLLRRAPVELEQLARRRRTRAGGARSARGACVSARVLGRDAGGVALVVPEARLPQLAASSSAIRAASASGSKVITNPGELGSDLLELLVERERGLGHGPMVPEVVGAQACLTASDAFLRVRGRRGSCDGADPESRVHAGREPPRRPAPPARRRAASRWS